MPEKTGAAIDVDGADMQPKQLLPQRHCQCAVEGMIIQENSSIK